MPSPPVNARHRFSVPDLGCGGLVIFALITAGCTQGFSAPRPVQPTSADAAAQEHVAADAGVTDASSPDAGSSAGGNGTPQMGIIAEFDPASGVVWRPEDESLHALEVVVIAAHVQATTSPDGNSAPAATGQHGPYVVEVPAAGFSLRGRFQAVPIESSVAASTWIVEFRYKKTPASPWQTAQSDPLRIVDFELGLIEAEPQYLQLLSNGQLLTRTSTNAEWLLHGSDRYTPRFDTNVGIAAHIDQGCGLLESGSLVCWGLNEYTDTGSASTFSEFDQAAPMPLDLFDPLGISLSRNVGCVYSSTDTRCFGLHAEKDTHETIFAEQEDSPSSPFTRLEIPDGYRIKDLTVVNRFACLIAEPISGGVDQLLCRNRRQIPATAWAPPDAAPGAPAGTPLRLGELFRSRLGGVRDAVCVVFAQPTGTDAVGCITNASVAGGSQNLLEPIAGAPNSHRLPVGDRAFACTPEITGTGDLSCALNLVHATAPPLHPFEFSGGHGLHRLTSIPSRMETNEAEVRLPVCARLLDGRVRCATFVEANGQGVALPAETLSLGDL